MCDIVAVRGRQAAGEVISRLAAMDRVGPRPVSVAELGGGRSLTAPRTILPLAMSRGRTFRAERPAAAGRLAIGTAPHLGQEPAERQPLQDCSGGIVVVHCGTIDNAAELRAALETSGHRFTSTDSGEVIPHAIEDALHHGEDAFDAFQTAVEQLRGSSAIAALIARHNSIFIARFGSPLSVRGTVGRCVVATEPAATEGVRGPLRVLEDGSIAELGTAWHWAGAPGRPPAPTADLHPDATPPTTDGFNRRKGTLRTTSAPFRRVAGTHAPALAGGAHLFWGLLPGPIAAMLNHKPREGAPSTRGNTLEEALRPHSRSGRGDPIETLPSARQGGTA